MDSNVNPPIQCALPGPSTVSLPATLEVASTLGVQETVLEGVSFLYRRVLRQGVHRIDAVYVFIFLLWLMRIRCSSTEYLSFTKHAIQFLPHVLEAPVHRSHFTSLSFAMAHPSRRYALSTCDLFS